ATVALAAFSGISAFVFSLAITTNREANRSLVSLPADMNTFRLMVQARYKLMPAQTGRITLVSPNEIRYTDASTGKKVVLLWDNGEENPEMRGLWFQEEYEVSDFVPIGNCSSVEDFTFDVDSRQRHVTVRMSHFTKDKDGKVSSFVREELV